MTTLVQVETPNAQGSVQMVPLSTVMIRTPPRISAISSPDIVQSAITGPIQRPAVSFASVSNAVLTDIIGRTLLGLGDIGISPEIVPSLLYKWHVWLKRMNDWVRHHAGRYPKQVDVPDTVLSADLYFASGKNVTSNPNLVPLGPLLPTEKNTFIRALQKGVSKCDASDDPNDLVSIVERMNKLSILAVGTTRAILDHIGVGSAPLTVARTATGSTAKKISETLETFEDEPSTYAKYRHPSLDRPRHNLRRYLQKCPFWVYTLFLMGLLYLFVTNFNDASAFASSSLPFTPGFMQGGAGEQWMPVIDISDF